MTPRRALVILAVECFAAHLLTWWAVSKAALLIAGVSLAVPHLPALCFAGESFSTLDLLLPPAELVEAGMSAVLAEPGCSAAA